MTSLKELRRSKGKTQDDMAAMLKISRVAYSHYERGRNAVRAQTVAKIARYLGIDVEDVIRSLPILPGDEEDAIDLNADMDTEEEARVEPYTLSEVLDAAHEAGKWRSATEMMEFAAWAHPKINGGSSFFIDGGERRSFLRMRVKDERKLWEEVKKK